jgi:hypothetical protein
MFSSLSVLVTSLRPTGRKPSATIASQESTMNKSTSFYGTLRGNGLPVARFRVKLARLRRFCASCATGSCEIYSSRPVPQSPKNTAVDTFHATHFPKARPSAVSSQAAAPRLASGQKPPPPIHLRRYLMATGKRPLSLFRSRLLVIVPTAGPVVGICRVSNAILRPSARPSSSSAWRSKS